MFATPTVVGDNVFIGSCSGKFYALDQYTGEQIWDYDTSNDGPSAQFHGDPIAVGQLIVTGSDAAEPSFVYGFDQNTGEVVWKWSVDSPETDILPVDGTLIGRTMVGDLVSFDSENGGLVWKVEGSGTLCRDRVRSPAYHDGRVYFTSEDGMLRVVSAGSGELEWETDLGCAAGAPRVWRGYLYVGLTSQKILKLSLEDGSIVAALDLEATPYSYLTPAGDVIVTTVGEKKLMALDADLGGIVWEHTTSSEWSAFRPLVWNGKVLAGDADGNLFAYNPADGSVAWQASFEGMIRGIGAQDDVIFVGTFQGMVYAYAHDMD